MQPGGEGAVDALVSAGPASPAGPASASPQPSPRSSGGAAVAAEAGGTWAVGTGRRPHCGRGTSTST